MILSSKIKFIDQNKNKIDQLELLHSEYIKCLNYYLDELWDKLNLDNYDFSKKSLRQYKFYPDKKYNIEKPVTPLSGRIIKSIQTQVIGMVKSRTKQLNSKYFVLEKLQKNKIKNKENIIRLQKLIQIEKSKLKKPYISKNIMMELNSTNFKKVSNSTKTKDAIYQLCSIWNTEFKKKNKLTNKVNFVVNFHRHCNNLSNVGKEKTSYLVGRDCFNIRYVIHEKDNKYIGDIAAIDQGITNCITMIDNFGNVHQSKPNKHNYSLNKIIKIMTKKKRGSKNFSDQQNHRTNYVNWCINQLDLSNIKELRVENLQDIGRGRNRGLFLSYFPYVEIRIKLTRICQLNGVRLVWQDNKYRSQRCNSCGFVHKGNRSGDVFRCKSCNYTGQADINAALNHLANITPIGLNPLSRTTGFYWNS